MRGSCMVGGPLAASASLAERRGVAARLSTAKPAVRTACCCCCCCCCCRPADERDPDLALPHGAVAAGACGCSGCVSRAHMSATQPPHVADAAGCNAADAARCRTRRSCRAGRRSCSGCCWGRKPAAPPRTMCSSRVRCGSRFAPACCCPALCLDTRRARTLARHAHTAFCFTPPPPPPPPHTHTDTAMLLRHQRNRCAGAA
jgi:hypothetical protein